MRVSVQIEFDKTMDVETQKTSVTIGRGTNNDIIIPHDSISRTHCTVELADGIFFITDLGSSNGTYIDGKKLAPNKRTAIKAEGQVKIGKLDSEFSETGLTQEEVTKAYSIKELNKDATTTMRIGRLDLNKPSVTLQMEKKKLVKGPRNPITSGIEAPKTKYDHNPKFFFIGLLVVVAIINLILIKTAMS